MHQWIRLLIYFHMWNGVGRKSSFHASAHINTGEMPKFLVHPPSTIFLSTSESHSSLTDPSFTIQVRPANCTLTARILRSRTSADAMHVPIISPDSHIALDMLHQPHILVQSEASTLDHTAYHVRLRGIVIGETLSFLASNLIGTVQSRPVKFLNMDLPEFPPRADEHLDLLLGNPGRILCFLPVSQPSMPTVNFYHDGELISEVRNGGSRFRLIYLGGDGSGLPWSERVFSRQSSDEVISWISTTSVAVLLIQPLKLGDSGEYRCEVELMGKRVLSTHKTLLNVTKPTKAVNPNLRFSSNDVEFAPVYAVYKQKSKQHRHWSFPVGYNLTLFCLVEGAPIVNSLWLYNKSIKNISVDDKFGVLTIAPLSWEHEGTYKCSSQANSFGSVSTSFQIVVTKHPELSVRSNWTPDSREIIEVPIGRNISLNCTCSGSDLEPADARFAWLFNGYPIKADGIENDLMLSNNQVHIVNFTGENAGIFQCYSEDCSNQWLSDSLGLILKNPIIKVESQSSAAPSVFLEERTERGLTAHLNCNMSSISSEARRSDSRIRFSWYRMNSNGELSDLAAFIASSERIKYLTSQVAEDVQILSIVNPDSKEDSGFYLCRILDNEQNTVLGEVKFELIVGDLFSASTNDHMMAGMKSSHVPPLQKETTTSQPRSSMITNTAKPFQLSSISSPPVDIDKDIRLKVVKLAPFSTFLWIKTTISNPIFMKKLKRLIVEYQERTDNIFRATMGHDKVELMKQLQDSSQLGGNWSAPILTDISATTYGSCYTRNDYLHAGNEYRFRVIGYYNGLEDSLPSVWSNIISFRDLLDIRPLILEILHTNATAVKLTWTLPDALFREVNSLQKKILLTTYTVLYGPAVEETQRASAWVSCSERSMEQRMRNYTTSTIYHASELIQTGIITLDRHLEYMFAMYARVQSEPTNMNSVKYTSLSDWVDFDMTPYSTTLTANTFVTGSGQQKDDWKNDSEDKEKSEEEFLYSADNHLVIVILGSIAGVLMVTAISLIMVCLWCQFRHKRGNHKAISECHSTVYKPSASHSDLTYHLNGYINVTDCVGGYVIPYCPDVSNSLQASIQRTSDFSSQNLGQFGTLQEWQQGSRMSIKFAPPWRHADQPILDGSCRKLSLSRTTQSFSINPTISRTDARPFRILSDHSVETIKEKRWSIGDSHQAGGDSSVYSKCGSQSTLNDVPPKIIDKPTLENIANQDNCIPLMTHGKEPRNNGAYNQIYRPIPVYLTPEVSPKSIFNPTFSNTDTEEINMNAFPGYSTLKSFELIQLQQIYAEYLMTLAQNSEMKRRLQERIKNSPSNNGSTVNDKTAKSNDQSHNADKDNTSRSITSDHRTPQTGSPYRDMRVDHRFHDPCNSHSSTKNVVLSRKRAFDPG